MIFLNRVFSKPEKVKIFRNQVIIEIDNLGIDSLGIVAIISVFMGAIVAIQTAFQITNPLIPAYTVGFATRQSMILEFSPTIVSLILAGKVGSRISSEIGTMRITEQIDALEIMGINSAEYLVLPKIVASVIINPVLVMASMFLGILVVGLLLLLLILLLLTILWMVSGLTSICMIFFMPWLKLFVLLLSFLLFQDIMVIMLRGFT